MFYAAYQAARGTVETQKKINGLYLYRNPALVIQPTFRSQLELTLLAPMWGVKLLVQSIIAFAENIYKALVGMVCLDWTMIKSAGKGCLNAVVQAVVAPLECAFTALASLVVLLVRHPASAIGMRIDCLSPA